MGKFDVESRKQSSDGIRLSKKDRRKPWQKHERDVAELVDGRLTPGSGNKPMHKGDVKNDMFMIECKSSKHRSLSIKLEWLEKISEEALCRNRFPMVQLRFDSNCASTCDRDWMLMPSGLYKALFGNGSAEDSK